MVPLFLVLTAFNLLALLCTAALGYAGLSSTHVASLHTLAGTLAAMACVAVHCVVFTYFIATAKWIRHAVTVKRLDPALQTPTRSFKMQAFPPGLLAIVSTFSAAIFGAAADNHYVPLVLHHSLALLAVGVNLFVAFFEYRAIVRNARLIDTILATLPPTDL